jgi:hypothetical protein
LLDRDDLAGMVERRRRRTDEVVAELVVHEEQPGRGHDLDDPPVADALGEREHARALRAMRRGSGDLERHDSGRLSVVLDAAVPSYT